MGHIADQYGPYYRPIWVILLFVLAPLLWGGVGGGSPIWAILLKLYMPQQPTIDTVEAQRLIYSFTHWCHHLYMLTRLMYLAQQTPVFLVGINAGSHPTLYTHVRSSQHHLAHSLIRVYLCDEVLHGNVMHDGCLVSLVIMIDWLGSEIYFLIDVCEILYAE